MDSSDSDGDDNPTQDSPVPVRTQRSLNAKRRSMIFSRRDSTKPLKTSDWSRTDRSPLQYIRMIQTYIYALRTVDREKTRCD